MSSIATRCIRKEGNDTTMQTAISSSAGSTQDTTSIRINYNGRGSQKLPLPFFHFHVFFVSDIFSFSRTDIVKKEKKRRRKNMGKIEKEARRLRKKEEIKQRRPALWQECMRKFHLSEEEVAMAKAVGIVPEKLINMPEAPTEKWKKPAGKWIRDEYAALEKKRKRREKRTRKTKLSEETI